MKYDPTRWVCQCKPAICGGTFYRYGVPISCPLWPKCHGNKHQLEFLYPQQSVFQRHISLPDPQRAKRHQEEYKKLRRCFDPEGEKKRRNSRYAANADLINAKRREKWRLAHPPGSEKPPVDIPLPPCGGDCADNCPYDDDCHYPDWEEDYLADLAKQKTAATRERQKEWRQAYIANETPEQKRERLAKTNARAKARRDNETPEQRAARLAKQNAFARKYRADSEKRAATAAKAREKRANETPEEKKERLAKRRAYKKARLASETPEQKEERLAKRRAYDKVWRANKTPGAV